MQDRARSRLGHHPTVLFHTIVCRLPDVCRLASSCKTPPSPTMRKGTAGAYPGSTVMCRSPDGSLPSNCKTPLSPNTQRRIPVADTQNAPASGCTYCRLSFFYILLTIYIATSASLAAERHRDNYDREDSISLSISALRVEHLNF
jgi:hypothetical protein